MFSQAELEYEDEAMKTTPRIRLQVTPIKDADNQLPLYPMEEPDYSLTPDMEMEDDFFEGVEHLMF